MNLVTQGHMHQKQEYCGKVEGVYFLTGNAWWLADRITIISINMTAIFIKVLLSSNNMLCCGPVDSNQIEYPVT